MTWYTQRKSTVTLLYFPNSCASIDCFGILPEAEVKLICLPFILSYFIFKNKHYSCLSQSPGITPLTTEVKNSPIASSGYLTIL